MANQFINGRIFSWSSIEMVGAGIPLEGIKSINYSDSLAAGMPRGKGPLARGYTLGLYTAKASIEIYLDQLDSFIAGLGGPGFGTVPIPLLVGYFEPLFGVRTDTVVGRIDTTDLSSSSDSADGISVKSDLLVIVPILWNGVPKVLPL